MTPITRDLLTTMPLPAHDADTDKDGRGAILAVGGGAMVPGALLLAGVAALRAGAGKLQLATSQPAAVPLAVAVPEALVFALPATPDGEIHAAAAVEALARPLKSARAVLVGPGIMDSDCAGRIAREVAAAAPEARLAIDAGALAGLGELDCGGRAVLTPHAGEMARLMGCTPDEVADDPEAVVRAAARRFNAVVALKGGVTRVASPDGALHVFADGRVGLATSGSGDTLAGVVAGLLARGAEPLCAALWAVWLHGEAGNKLAARVGPLGFLARELLAEIPGLMAGR